MVRPPSCGKLDVKRGLWTAEEDAKILAYVSKHGIDNWTLLPKKAGLNRCGKSCRLRWTNYLRPALKHHSFTPQEEDLVVKLHKAIGSRWSLIAKELPGRTDNDVKNYWNTKLRKKLTKMGIDPVTHKPYSQILTEHGNISAGLNRCGKSCRLRWTNYLRPALKHHSFTPQEEDLIVKLHKAIGSRWSLIAKELPGRTDNDVKNYWNTKLRKKLTKMGIDPVTHKPYSQILTEHGNISGLPNTATPMGFFSGGGLNHTSVSVSGLSYTNNIDDLEPLVEQFQVLNLNQETVRPTTFLQ